LSPFAVLHGYKPSKPLDLLPMSPYARVSESANAFAHVHDFHNGTSKQIQASNVQYQIEDDFCSCLTEFNIEDNVMVWIRSERFPFGSV
jgi:hypothetical protein